MRITEVLSSDLSTLTAALDVPGADIETTLDRLVSHAEVAVPSLIGLSVAITGVPSPFEFDALAGTSARRGIAASLRVPLSAGVAVQTDSQPAVTLTLYAATPGAFVDLAADLAWLTGRPLADSPLDEHLAFRASRDYSTSATASSTTNQALGVLIGRGLTPEQAERELDAWAAEAGVARHIIAILLLAAVTNAVSENGIELS